MTILKMSFLDINFDENSFDVLWSRGALFHISKEDFHQVVKKLSSILKLNGIFYIQLIEGNHNNMIKRIGDVDGAAFYAYYTRDELNAIMSDYGFELVHEYSVEGWLNYYYKLTR